MIVDVHIYASYLASVAACEMLEILPESDLLDELNEILLAQCDILRHIVENKHYGSERLGTLIEEFYETRRQIERLKKKN